MFKNKEPRYKITEAGINHLEESKNRVWYIPIPLILMHLVDNPSGAYLSEFKDCSVNADYLLKKLCKESYVEMV